MNVKISGTGIYIPKNLVTNKDLFKKISNFDQEIAKKSIEKKGKISNQENISIETIFDIWVKQVSGIAARPFLDKDEFPSNLGVEYMAYQAAKKALENSSLLLEDIDHLILSTYSSDRILPPPACKVVDFLGLKNVSVRTLNGACSGFLDAFIDGIIKISSGFYNNILVIASEQLSNKINFKDPRSAIIFGDGAGALILSKANDTKQSKVLSFDSLVNYSEQIYFERNDFVELKGGPLVERNAVKSMYEVSHNVLQKVNLSFNDIDYVIPHQANIRIIEALEKKINNNSCVVLKSIEQNGNLSSATIPIVLNELIQQKLSFKKSLSKILLTSVGAGYTYAAALIEI